ncbi:hypothetical protein CAC42_5202 [Sphaceloma murrayae]|uniref:RNA exonuclease 4 n=1 Tax=Sphaceloma murrayae TaxID=2082308 RepID=A0A2K1QUV9_9PEZI|nr:hypothetical protein CAC42_5202 [Sphaceloma murrayae]
MPGVELSSNWKKLQSSIKSDAPSTTTSPNLKRKRPSPPTTSNPPKRRPPPPHKRQKMTPPTSPPPSTSGPLDISTPPPPHLLNSGLTSAPAGRYLSLDCEMVSTRLHTHSLARVSITNYHHALLYDSFVLPLPSDPVVDYRTAVSGVQPQHLRPGVARPFAEVQRSVADLLRGRVLVGHALGNDFKVLGLDHPGYAIRDTARYKGFRKYAGGRTPGLKVLAREVLGLGIQDGRHDSVVDARCAMELFRREKGGMEREVRVRFGRLVERRGVGVVKGKVGKEEEEDEEEEEEEEEDVKVAGEQGEDEEGSEDAVSTAEGSELLDGESDGSEGGTGENVTAEEPVQPAKKTNKKKRRKHKSRTTRA